MAGTEYTILGPFLTLPGPSRPFRTLPDPLGTRQGRAPVTFAKVVNLPPKSGKWYVGFHFD